MATQVQAAVAQKASTIATTATSASVTSGSKSLNGVNVNSSSAGVAAAVSTTESVKASIGANSAIQNSTAASLSTLFAHKHTSSYESISIDLSEEQKLILKQGACSFGDALSRVPWMKFRVIAEPNMDIFASDLRLRTFIREVTELTVSIVTKQCNEEIAVLIAALIASLNASMEVRIKVIVETIIEQIASLCLEDTMTGCHNLHDIKEKVCFPRHCEPHRSNSYDDHKHPHESYGDADKHKHPHETYGDSDKYKQPHETYGDSDKHKHPHETYGDKPHDSYGDSEKHKHGDGKHHRSDTPTKKHSGGKTALPGTKTAS